MSHNQNIALAVRRALVLGALGAAFVQPAHAAEEGSSTIQEVVVSPGCAMREPVTTTS